MPSISTHRSHTAATRSATLALLATLTGLALFVSAAPLRPSTHGAGALSATLNVQLQLGGATNSLAVDWPRGYIGLGARMAVLDLADPLKPRVLGQTDPLPGLVVGLSQKDGIVYASLGPAGLVIVDAVDVFHPRVVGQLAGQVSEVVIGDPYLYLVGGTTGARIVDASNPAAPQVVGSFDAFVTGLALHGTEAFVISTRLTRWDVSVPANPRSLEVLADWADAATVSGDTLYATTAVDESNGQRTTWLQAWNLPSPHAPQPLAKVPLSAPGRYIAIHNNQLWVLAANRLTTYNTDGASLAAQWSVAVPLAAQEATPVDVYAYLAAGGSGLRAVRQDGQSAAEGVRVLPFPGRPETLALSSDGARVYVEDADERVLIYKADDVGAGPLGAFAASVSAGAMTEADGYLYFGTSDRRLRVWDVRDPAATREVASLSFPQLIVRIAVRDGVAYLATDPFLRVLDVRDPSHPQQIGQHQPDGGVTDIALAVDGKYLYATGPATGAQPGRPSLKVIDVSYPPDPLARGETAALSAQNGLATAGTFVYVDAVQVVDACNARSPVEVGRLATPDRTRDIALDGWRLYAAKRATTGGGAVQLMDVRMPTQPQAVAALVVADTVEDVVAQAGTFWASGRDAGLIVGQAPEYIPPTPTPTVPPEVTRPSGLNPQAYLPLLRDDPPVARCPAR